MTEVLIPKSDTKPFTREHREDYEPPIHKVYTYQEIADEMGVSITYVVQLEQSGLDKIRQYLVQNTDELDRMEGFLDHLTKTRERGA